MDPNPEQKPTLFLYIKVRTVVVQYIQVDNAHTYFIPGTYTYTFFTIPSFRFRSGRTWEVESGSGTHNSGSTTQERWDLISSSTTELEILNNLWGLGTE